MVFPFKIKVDPMERLLLIGFENDPDSIYEGFEPQVFNDRLNGEGHLIIGWRTDNKVDVYHQKSLNPDPNKYTIAGAGLNNIIPIDLEASFFELDDRGVQAHDRFIDLSGRVIEIKINESSSRKRELFGLLAPMGDAAANPRSMPLILLQDFYFVRKKQTEIFISIANKLHKVDTLPVCMDWQRMTFVRYSSKPFIALLNPEFDGKLAEYHVQIGQESVVYEDHACHIEWIDKKPYIRSIEIIGHSCPFSMNFSPSVPCLDFVQDHMLLSGEFRISGHESVGSIAGEYAILSRDDSITIRFIPTMGWTPKTTKLSTWFLFTVAKVFKKWPTTYQWNAEMNKLADGSWNMRSKWIRTGRINA